MGMADCDAGFKTIAVMFAFSKEVINKDVNFSYNVPFNVAFRLVTFFFPVHFLF